MAWRWCDAEGDRNAGSRCQVGWGFPGEWSWAGPRSRPELPDRGEGQVPGCSGRALQGRERCGHSGIGKPLVQFGVAGGWGRLGVTAPSSGNGTSGSGQRRSPEGSRRERTRSKLDCRDHGAWIDSCVSEEAGRKQGHQLVCHCKLEKRDMITAWSKGCQEHEEEKQERGLRGSHHCWMPELRGQSCLG